jgi:predicted TIM-barrel fold metal-dependent hydrolase
MSSGCFAGSAESGGRLYPFCRLDPAEGPVGEAERCLALGARGIKLHPRAQALGFSDAVAESIWKVAECVSANASEEWS